MSNTPFAQSRQTAVTPWTARRDSRPISSVPALPKSRVTRRFECEWLEDGEVLTNVTVAPALPVFEQAFGAFSHGVLFQTSDGPVAVEDLEPGMHLECANGKISQLLWKGAITIVPGAPTLADRPDRMYRVMPDAFGIARPVQDQTFGPHARRLDRDAKIRGAIGSEAALVPLSAMADGTAVIEVTPLSPTRVYHLACEGHETLLAAGLEVESFHPGPELPLSLSEEMLALFMSFFPHLATIRDFGRLAAPRLTAEDYLSIV